MPMIFYSKDEFEQMRDGLNVKAMSLAQRLAEAKGFPCIRKPNNAGPSDRNDYCCGCPALDGCPYEYKRYAP